MTDWITEAEALRDYAKERESWCDETAIGDAVATLRVNLDALIARWRERTDYVHDSDDPRPLGPISAQPFASDGEVGGEEYRWDDSAKRWVAAAPGQEGGE